jgi:hypothetical protein
MVLMFVPTSLNKYVPWKHLLKLLELPCVSQGLPAVTRCPDCLTGRLKILQDQLSGGQWHSCEECGLCGDMLTLAQHCWQLDLAATVVRLRQSGLVRLPGLQGAVQIHQNCLQDCQDRPARLWQEARQSFLTCNQDVPRIMQRLQLGRVRENRWESGMGHLVGAMSLDRTEELLPTGRRRPTTQQRRQGAFNDVLVVPFQDLPGRYSSFLMLGRQGRLDKDLLVKTSPLLSQTPVGRSEHGLLYHPQVFAEATRWQNTVLVMADPFQMLGLQARQFDRAFRGLPLVAWYPHGDRRPQWSWQAFGGFRRVLWSPGLPLDPVQLAQAISQEMAVSRLGPDVHDPRRLQEFLWYRPADQTAELLIGSAQPWPVVVADYLRDADDSATENFLRGLQLEGLEINQVLARLPNRLASRCRGTLRADPAVTRGHFDKWVVLEQDSAWWVADAQDRPGSIIMNAVLRLDSVTHLRRSGRTFYRGRLIHDGDELAFTAPLPAFDRNPNAFLRNLLLDRKNALLQLLPAWNRRLVTLAQVFQPVASAPGVDRAGWVAEDQQFVLPQFTVNLHGVVTATPDQFCEDTCPAQSLSPPEHLSPQDLDSLNELDDDARAVTCALVAAIAASILSRAAGRLPGLITVSSQYDRAREIAELCGCRYRQLQQARDVTSLMEDEALHDWPLLVEAHARNSDWFRRWLYGAGEEPLHNALLTCGWLQAASGYILQGWCAITSTEAYQLTAGARQLLPRLIPAYLQDICARQLQLPDADSWFGAVATDLIDFVTRQGGDRAAWQGLWTVAGDGSPRSRAEAFADLTGQLVRNGSYVVRPAEYADPELDAFLITGDDLLVPRQGLIDFLAKSHGILFEPAGELTSLLLRAGLSSGDDGQHWQVPLAWWQKRFQQNELASRRWRLIS